MSQFLAQYMLRSAGMEHPGDSEPKSSRMSISLRMAEIEHRAVAAEYDCSMCHVQILERDRSGPGVQHPPFELLLEIATGSSSNTDTLVNQWLDDVEHGPFCLTRLKIVYARSIATVNKYKYPRGFTDADTFYCWHFHRLAERRIDYLKRNPMDKNSPEWFYRHAKGYEGIFKLPLELRQEVYSVLLRGPSGDFSGPAQRLTQENKSSYARMLLTGRQMSLEMEDFFYSKLTMDEHLGRLVPLGRRPSVSRARHWNLHVLRAHPARRENLWTVRYDVEMFCNFLMRTKTVKTVTVVDDHGLDWQACTCRERGCGQYYRQCRPTNGVERSCSIIPRVTEKHRAMGQGPTAYQCDYEYVLEPLKRMRGLQKMQVNIPRGLQHSVRLQDFKATVETLAEIPLAEDDEDERRVADGCTYDFGETSKWYTLAEAARRSLLSPNAGPYFDAPDGWRIRRW